MDIDNIGYTNMGIATWAYNTTISSKGHKMSSRCHVRFFEFQIVQYITEIV